MILDTFVDRQGSLCALSKCLRAALDGGAKSLYVLACDNNELDRERLDPILRAVPIPIFGGRFPAIVHNDSMLEHGWIVCGLDQRVTISVHRDISAQADVELVLPATVTECPSLVVILDAMSLNIEHLMSELYSRMGPGCSVLGGGAGSLNFVSKPCVFTNDGLLADCLQIVGLCNRIGVNFRHGWQRLAGPFLVTDADGNTIKTLNYRSALEVYKDAIEPHCRNDPRTATFFDLYKSYPLGIDTLDEAVLVRNPILAKDGTLTCMGQVPESAIVYVLQGMMSELLDAARDAAIGCHNEQSGDLLLFDCIGRKLLMNSEFGQELDSLNAHLSDDASLVGALSLGEIANTASGSIQFHSNSVVLGAASRENSLTSVHAVQE